MTPALASLAAALALAPLPQGGDLPFERLGQVLLEAAAQSAAPARSSSQQLEVLGRLAPLHTALDLGAVELWVPLHTATSEGELEDAPWPREWKAVAELAVGLERRWCAALGELEGAAGEETERALDALESAVRRGTQKSRPESLDACGEQARALRAKLLGGPGSKPLVIVLAPERAQYLAVIGAAGLIAPNLRHGAWTETARRGLVQALGPSVALVALSYGPRREGESPFLDQDLDLPTLRQNVVHGASHMLCNRLAPSAPDWMHEGIVLVDTVALCGADETLCSGYGGRQPTIFDDLREVPQAFLIFTRSESSPFRSGASADLFRDALKAARAEDGFRVLDLDRGTEGLIARGSFLGSTALVPPGVLQGPKGLKEGFAEFFRAYCGAFVAWLGAPREDGPPWLERALRELRARAPKWSAQQAPQLHEILREITGLELGEWTDPELDLEARFVHHLTAKR
jgi:hypothetical protein